ncbi:dna replication complex gins protein sld5 [Moniliophthora roreri MCA 2997]|uniref:DNA replication complex GINS protein SLD5 n=2 Tax=Moniliophthora roreri TaxID=221103 RepID=V2WR54_MONRO|nr:dna replication complex gins protein sld5 [Moniliophthora roreri MCA 2997]
MDWEAQYQAGILLNDASTSSRSRNTSSRRRNQSALLDDDDEPGDASMAGPSDDAALQAILEPPTEETPLEKLMRHWMNERHCPDILPAEEDLLSSLLDHIRRQSDAVQLLRGEPSTSEEEHLRITLVQTEVERVKFVVRSYVRTRLYKIEKYARWIMQNPEIQTRITKSEQAHASRHANLTDRHLHQSVLQSLPETQSHLDDTPIFMPPMVTTPDNSRPVFVHALRSCAPIRFADGTSLQMERGHISLMPYSAAEELLLQGDVELV